MARDGGLTIYEALAGVGARRLAAISWAALRGKRRSFAEDAASAVALLAPPPRVEGRHHVPAREPFVLVANHWQSSNLWVGLVAATITAVVAGVRDAGAKELHWLVLSEWRWLEVRGRWIPNPLSALLFPRFSLAWGLISTPARPSDTPGRARALRRMLGYLGLPRRTGRVPEAVALFPEGTATTALGEARPGVGTFLQRISSLGVPLLPTAAYQEEGRLIVRFGPPLYIRVGPNDARDMDEAAAEQVMVAIGRLLPPALRGVHADAIAAERDVQR